MSTFAPAAANAVAVAVASPMPRAAPVIAMTRPRRSCFILDLPLQ